VAGTALALAEEDLLPAQLRGSGLAWIELSEHVKLWRRRESQHLLKPRHDVDLMTALENVYALLRRDYVVAVEIGAPLLESDGFTLIVCGSGLADSNADGADGGFSAHG
jgi:hypothetical protein